MRPKPIEFAGPGFGKNYLARAGVICFVACVSGFFLSALPAFSQESIEPIDLSLPGKLKRLIEEMLKPAETGPAEPVQKVITIKLGGEKSLEALDQFADRLFEQLAGAKNDVDFGQVVPEIKKEAQRALDVFRDNHAAGAMNWANSEIRKDPAREALFYKVYDKLYLLRDFTVHDWNPPWSGSDLAKASKLFNSEAKARRLMYLGNRRNYQKIVSGVDDALKAPAGFREASEKPAPRIGKAEPGPNIDWGQYFIMSQYDAAIAYFTGGQHPADVQFLSVHNKSEFQKRVDEDRKILKHWQDAVAQGNLYSVARPESRSATDYTKLYDDYGHFIEEVNGYFKGPNGLSHWRGYIDLLEKNIEAYKKWKESNEGLEIVRFRGIAEVSSELTNAIAILNLREAMYFGGTVNVEEGTRLAKGLSQIYKDKIASELESRIKTCESARGELSRQSVALCQAASSEVESLRGALSSFLLVWKDFISAERYDPPTGDWKAAAAAKCAAWRELAPRVEGALASQPELTGQFFSESMAGLHQESKKLLVFLISDCSSEGSDGFLNGNPILSMEAPTLVGGKSETRLEDLKEMVQHMDIMFRQGMRECVRQEQAGIIPATVEMGRGKAAASAGGPVSEESVKKLYDDFSKAYESANPAGVLALLSRSWSTSEGQTLGQLQSHLSNTFIKYRGLTCRISGLILAPPQEANMPWEARYHMVIEGELAQHRGFTNKEESDVVDKVGLENGVLRILSTEKVGADD